MPSGIFHSIPISQIYVNREARQRKEVGDVSDLADSIRRVGLIHPILIRRDNKELVVGERRLSAARALGWTHIAAQYEDELDPLELKALEYEENIRRKALPWVEEVEAVKGYHELKLKIDPAWTHEQTAEALGVSRQDISDKLQVAKDIKANPKLATVERFSTARNIVRRSNERKADAEIAAATGFIKKPSTPSLVENVSFLEWAPLYEGPKFNLIHCDFPYGINADKINQGNSRAEFGDYADSEDVYWELLETLANQLDSFCADSAHLMFWFSMKFYTPTVEFLRKKTDFIIDDFPFIWFKSDGQGLLPDPQRGPRRIYETALFGRRGDRKIVAAVSNAVSLPSGGRIHMSQKPEAVLRHFFKMLVDDTTSLLDPTCGSATALSAAKALKAKTVLGLEMNSEFAERANRELSKAPSEALDMEELLDD